MRHAIVTLAALLATVGCSTEDSLSYVVLTVDAPTAVAPVERLRTTWAMGGHDDIRLFPERPAAKAIAFPATLAVSLEDRSGDLGVVIEALGDDGHLVASCFARLRVEKGTSYSTCLLAAGEPSCGNGSPDPGEECDDRNRASGDGCSADCRIEHFDGGAEAPSKSDGGVDSSSDLRRNDAGTDQVPDVTQTDLRTDTTSAPDGKKANGTPCTDRFECQSGFCLDGLCCNTACPTCRRCDYKGFEGKCVNMPEGTQDEACNGANSCTGYGYCDKTKGQACSEIQECASGGCGGVCSDPGANEPLGGSCLIDSQCASKKCADTVCCSTETCPLCYLCDFREGSPTAGDCLPRSYGRESWKEDGSYCLQCDGAGGCLDPPGGGKLTL